VRVLVAAIPFEASGTGPVEERGEDAARPKDGF